MSAVNLGRNTYSLLFYIFLLFPFIQQRTYQETPYVEAFYRIYTIVASIIMFMVAIPKFKMIYKKNLIIKVVTLFIGIYILSSIVNPTRGAIRSIYTLFGFYALSLFIFSESKYSLQKILSALSYIYGFFIFGNFITDILFPDGLYEVTKSSYHSAHLLGDDNAIIYVVLPGLSCLMCNSLQKHHYIKLYVWVALLISIYTLVSVWSVSAFLCIILFTMIILFDFNISKIHPYLLFVSVFAIVFIVIWGLTNPSIGGFIENTLEKDITLSGRTVLWYKAFIMIIEKPYLGWGGYFINGKFDLNPVSYPCHTPYLQMMIDGGFILFAVFILLTILIYREASKKDFASSCILIAALSCMLINYITEWSQHYHYFIIILLIANLKYFKNDDFSAKGRIKKERLRKQVGIR